MSNTETTALRDEALRKIGRNIVNFQRMERALKVLIVRSDIRGHASELAEVHRRKAQDVDRKPMGWLVDEFMRAVYAKDPPRNEETSDLSEAWISFSFSIETDKETIHILKRALSLLVAERNALIHKMLGNFDGNSEEGCRNLISLLDGQQDRLKPHYESVTRMLGDLDAAQREVLKQMEALLLTGSKDA